MAQLNERIEWLLARFRAGTISPEELKEMDRWFSGEMEKRAEAVIAEDEQAVRQRMLLRLQQSVRKEKTKARPIVRWAVAASLILLASASYIYRFDAGYMIEELAMQQMEIPHGRTATVYLPDRTKVILNAGSKLRYPRWFLSGERHVHLEGEGFFEVKRDTRHAFKVHMGSYITEVLGTSFNIQAYEFSAHWSVAVATGKVKVYDTGPSQQNSRQISLLPDQQVTIDRNNQLMALAEVNHRNSLAWTEGILHLHQADLAQLASILARWYGVEVEVENEEYASCYAFFGRFKNQSIKNVLEASKAATDFDYEFKDENKLILRAHKCNK